MTARAITDTLAARAEETPLKFCASLAFCDATHYVEIALAAEAHGFHTLVLSDHVVHPETIASRYPYNRSGERPWQAAAPWPDVWVATAAMAAVTERLRFLPGVYVLPLRDPFTVAKALGTAAVLSNYRVALGVGLGWMREEFDLLGSDFAQRGARADEMIEVLRLLFTGKSVEHRGRFFDFDALRMRPAVSGPVPIVVGGSSEAALRRAARIGDGWIAHLLSTDVLGDAIARLRRYRREAGRESAPLDVYAPCRDAFDLDGYHRLEEIGVTHLLTAPWFAEGGPAAPLAAKKESLARFADAVIARM